MHNINDKLLDYDLIEAIRKADYWKDRALEAERNVDRWRDACESAQGDCVTYLDTIGELRYKIDKLRTAIDVIKASRAWWIKRAFKAERIAKEATNE